MSLKALIILRGLPGSGKSTLAKIISEEGKYPVFGIDDYFTDPKTGEYHFVFERNHLAYAACQEKTRAAMQTVTPKIILHNVFSMDWEMEPYFQLAAGFGYQVHVATVENHHGNKNVHEISEEQVKKMAEKFKVKLI